MKIKKTIIFLFALLFASILHAKNTLTTVPFVDLARYTGKWYQLALIPNQFQKDCISKNTATYTRLPDGTIQVRNACERVDGPYQIEGLARIEDPKTQSKLGVSFFSILGIRPIWAPYWIIGLDTEYQWVIVGEPDRKFGWVLSRTPTLDEKTWALIEKIMLEKGYSPKQFVKTP